MTDDRNQGKQRDGWLQRVCADVKTLSDSGKVVCGGRGGRLVIGIISRSFEKRNFDGNDERSG